MCVGFFRFIVQLKTSNGLDTVCQVGSWLTRVERAPGRLGPHPDDEC
jgi:hypothetical protein